MQTLTFSTPQSQELTFTLLAAKASLQPGPTEVTLPLAVRGSCADSPALLLTLRGHVVMPDVETSADALDFGTVWNCHCKVRPLGQFDDLLSASKASSELEAGQLAASFKSRGEPC